MKRIIIIAASVVALVALLSGALPTMAAKPQKSGSGKDVITLSNGFPSGYHETLNIHGKNLSFECTVCDPALEQCNVVNIPEYGEAKIIYVSGRKVKIGELTVFDSCAGFDGPDDSAEVWLPYEELGYWVFARALGKPAKGDPNDLLYEPRSIIFQNAESDNPTIYSLFGDVTNPGDIPLMLPLGLITKDGAYKMMSTDEAGINLVRFDSEPTGKGRGKTLGKNITEMFMWSGTVFHWSLDLNGDGAVNELDVAYACWGDSAVVSVCEYDLDNDGVIDEVEFENWLTLNTEGWVFPPSLDLNGDAAVNQLDVEYECWSSYDTNANGIIDYADLLAIGDANGDGVVDRLDLAYVSPCSYDLDNNGVIDPWDDSYMEADEFESWLEDKIPGDQTESDFYVPLWVEYETPVWVFTIADLVYQNQLIANEGIKNLQIRFYPVDGTEFTPSPQPEP
jgi:hypothetical protein